MPHFEKDLTRGNVAKKLMAFSFPFILSNLIQSLYSVADMIIIGNFTSAACLNGVSNATQLTMLFTNAVIGLSLGGTVLVGQYLGGGNKKELKSTIGTLFSLLILIAAALSIFAPFAARPLFAMMRVDAGSMKDALAYFITVMSGTVFVFAFNALSGVLRGLGDSKHPMIFVAIAAGINIVLDLLFIVPLGWGAFGAALATVISQAISVVLTVAYLIKHKFVFDFKFLSFKIDKEKLKLMLKIGLPTMFNNICVSFSFVFLMSMANILDPSGGGAVGIIGKYDTFAILPALGMSSSISAMVAQNFGAGDISRVKKTYKTGLLLSLSFTAAIYLFTVLFTTQILGAFTNDGNLISLGKDYMLFFTLDFIIVPFQFCFNGLFIGTGHTGFALISGVASSLLFRIPFSYLFAVTFGFGMKGLGAGAPIASLAATVISTLFYLSGRWKTPPMKSSEKENAPLLDLVAE